MNRFVLLVLSLVLATPAILHAEETKTAAPAADVGMEDNEALRRELETVKREMEETKRILEALLPQGGIESEGEVEGFRVYGFADVGLQKVWPHRLNGVRVINESTAATFVLGNINLYFDFQPGDRWSFLTELRFTTLPQGEDMAGLPGAPYRRTDTAVYDKGRDMGWGRVRLGSVIPERSYIQWQGNDKISIRAGLFLTPYGIWNVDHGSPTLISLLRPKFMQPEMFPERQLGVEALGTFELASGQLGYHATVSNGRTPGQFDLTDGKMWGGRLTYAGVGGDPFTIGLSTIVGSYSDQFREAVSMDPFIVKSKETVAYDERAHGLDVSYDPGRLRLRAEASLRNIDYEPGKHEPTWSPGVVYADHNEWGGYVLAGYRLSRLVEPYVYVEFYRWPTPDFEALFLPSAGFNLHFNAATTLKTQYHFERALDIHDFNAHKEGSSHFLAMRLVRAF